MYAVVFLSLLAGALAAPQYRFPPPPPHHHHHHHEHNSDLDGFINERSVFDTGRFFNDFNREMEQLEKAIEELMKHFPNQATSGLQGNQYKININLNGFDEKEITVKARDGLVMVQAVHKAEDGSERNYLDVRSLPSFVKAETGTWTYNQALVKIVFDVQQSTTEVAVTTESAETTQAPDREEMESHENDNTDQDADVGARGDNEIITNEIPDKEETVEATTYAVNFNNEVEFVPVRLNQNVQ